MHTNQGWIPIIIAGKHSGFAIGLVDEIQVGDMPVHLYNHMPRIKGTINNNENLYIEFGAEIHLANGVKNPTDITKIELIDEGIIKPMEGIRGYCLQGTEKGIMWIPDNMVSDESSIKGWSIESPELMAESQIVEELYKQDGVDTSSQWFTRPRNIIALVVIVCSVIYLKM